MPTIFTKSLAYDSFFGILEVGLAVENFGFLITLDCKLSIGFLIEDIAG
jgi:hypothetical protein